MRPLVRGRRLFLLLFVFLVPSLLGVVSRSLADGSSGAKRMEAIRQRMDQGQAAYVGKNYQAAAQIFEDGYAAYPYSAFLFNAGVCYQKLESYERALTKFRDYLRVDPSAPDAAKVGERIKALEAALAAAQASEAGLPEDAGDAGSVDTDAGDAGDVGDAGFVPDAGPPPPILPDDDQAMKSLVVVETEPAGAPLKMYLRVEPGAPAFLIGGQNPGWREVASTQAPANFTLAVGRYHVVVDKFRDFNVSHTDIDVQPGHVHQFKANLSQGEFMAFLRVAANAQGAYVYLDDKAKQRPPWGTTPHGELVPAGRHEILIEAPGFEPQVGTVDVKHGEQRELEFALTRLPYGFVRFHSNTDVKVFLDGEPKADWRMGDKPIDIKAAAGPHKLEVTSVGRKDLEGTIEVPRGQVLPVHATMIQKYPRGGAWTEAIVGAVLIGGGVYTGIVSNQLYEDLEADRKAGTLEKDDSRATAGTWLAVGSNVGFAGGAVLLGLATYNFIKDPLPESSTQIDAPVEFDDPNKAPPTAALEPKRRLERRAERPVRPLKLGGAPAGAGFGLEGRF
ncbi:MAG TPA: PEGA domain-containing protein [Polyangiaceae bacterium]